MTGSDGQTYGLLYEEPGSTAYAAGIWVMSQRQVTIEAGEPRSRCGGGSSPRQR